MPTPRRGFLRSLGAVTSLHFLGRAYSETTLIAAADLYQKATDWHRKRPPVPKV